MPIANRVEGIAASSITRISQQAQQLAAQGRDIVRLDAGEPDFATPAHIVDAAKAALDTGYTHYTSNGGLPEVKEAVQFKFRRDNNLYFDIEQVMVTCGAKQALFDVCMALLHPEDEVVVPAPYWGTYPAMAQLTGARMIEAPSYYGDGFMLTADALDACLGKRTRMVILNSPTNPTGRVYDRKTLSALGEVLLAYPDVFVVSDDIYEHLRYTGEPYCNILNVCPSLKRRTLVINGVSKAYAMTGWRVGFAAGPAPLIAAMEKIQGQSTSHTAAVSQKAAEAALLHGGVDAMAEQFGARSQRVARGLQSIDAVACLPAQGSFYCLPDFSKIIASLDEVADDQQMGDWLLERLGIAMVPGSGFGAPGYMRLSFAADNDTIDTGIHRLQQTFG